MELVQIILGPISGAAVLLSVTAVFVAGFVRGFVGFGAAMIIIMALSMVLGPRAAVAVASLAGVVTTIQLLPVAVRLADRPFVVPFGVASFVAAPLGTFVLVTLDPAIMKMAIAVFVLFMVAMMWRGWRIGRGGPVTVIGTGLTAGLIQGSAGVGGPPAVALALARPGTASQQRANVIGAVSSLTFCGIPALWYHGLFTREVIVVSCLIVPPYVFSTWLGAKFFSQQGQNIFRATALWVLAIAGVVTLVLAVRDYVS